MELPIEGKDRTNSKQTATENLYKETVFEKLEKEAEVKTKTETRKKIKKNWLFFSKKKQIF